MRVTVFVKISMAAAGSEARRFLQFRGTPQRGSTPLRSKEVANQPLFLFILDAGKEFRAQPGDGFRLIKRQTIVHFTAGKMTRLTARLKDRLDLSCKVRLLCGGANDRRRKVL